MEESQLFQSSFHRAVADTIHVPRQNPWFFWSIGIVMVALGGFLGTVYTPEGSGRFISAICPTAVVILGAIIGIIIIFIINLILAPYRQRNEARKKVVKLEEERIPHIIASPFTTQPQGSWDTNTFPSAELSVKNISRSTALDEVSVQISECFSVFEKQDEPGIYYLHGYLLDGWHPANVYWSERTDLPNQLSVSISPEETKSALIAFRKKLNPALGIFNTPTYPVFVDGVKITIEVSSTNSAMWKGEYYLKYRPPRTNKFDFIKWDEWESTHNVIKQ